MNKQIYNPFLPLNEYVPDGEPHVFGERVYLYGSHDKANSDRFCVQDYTVYSAPVNDLSDWTCHGISYKKSQDLRAQGKTQNRYPDFYAPDCVRGNDGKYYLYYFAVGPNVCPFGPMSVAVSDRPEGPFEYLGDIRNADGTPMMTYLTNDPAVINDNGRIWLYYGWAINRDFRSKIMQPLYRLVQSKLFRRSKEEIKATKQSIMGCACLELCNDMVTVKTAPKLVLDSVTTADKKSELYHHAFYEAASIRKVDDLYYLVYSSGVNNELAYATSKYPNKDFKFRGVIVSNSDLGLDGNKRKKNLAGTIHGGFEKINGQYYIFYHRCTNNTDFSRQACAEPIEIEKDGTIKQVGITSCGLSGKPLEGKGSYPAAICCYLYDTKTPVPSYKKREKHSRVTEDNGEVYICGVRNKTVIGYKYFDFNGATKMSMKYRGNANGKLCVAFSENGESVADIKITPSENWTILTQAVKFPNRVKPLFLRFIGKGKLDILEIIFE